MLKTNIFKRKSFKPKKNKSAGGKGLSNRTIIGIICIVVALIMCFGIAPIVNTISNGRTSVVRMTKTLSQGSYITSHDIEVVEVGSHNLPKGVITKAEEVVGTYCTTDLYAGDYLFEQKITSDQKSATDILGGLDGEKKVISVTIDSFAQGLSGKLETGDIVSVIVYSSKEGKVYTPPELNYLRVVTSTTSKGIDKADVTDSTQPVTVTFVTNKAQAELLALLEQTATMHFALEYRGDAATAQKYLDVQAAYFGKTGE